MHKSNFLWSYMVFPVVFKLLHLVSFQFFLKTGGKQPIGKHLGYLLLCLTMGVILLSSDDIKRDHHVFPFHVLGPALANVQWKKL